jgi:RNA polymerase sigma-70 factor (ECF subfamily)
MIKTSVSLDSAFAPSPNFAPTRWTLVRCAGSFDCTQSGLALEELCQTYWYPLYAFIRRSGHSAHDAQDLVQDFFVRLLKSNSIIRANPRLGKFRTFLLGALKLFLADSYRKTRAQKRGGRVEIMSLDEMQAEERYQLEAVDYETPEQIFEHRCTVALLETAITRLREEFQSASKERQFELLKVFLTREGDEKAYLQAAIALNSTPKAVAVAVHRIRRRLRQLVRSAIAETVSTPEEVEEEYRRLFA